MFGRPNSLLNDAPPIGPSSMMSSADAMRSGLPIQYFDAPAAHSISPLPRGEAEGVKGSCAAFAGAAGSSQGCGSDGSRRCETVKPVRPAFGFAPIPVAPSSRISPPDPVAAPGNGAIAVG